MVEFEVRDFLHPWEAIRAYLLLRRSEHWSPAEFLGYQAERLARLLRHCASNVPYYQIEFRALGLSADSVRIDNAFEYLGRMPVLQKDTVTDDPVQFVASSAANFNPKPIQTSGTTGTPLSLYWDRGSNVMELCCTQRVWRWAGVRPGHSFLDLRSRLLSSSEKQQVQRGRVPFVRNWKINGLEVNADVVSAANIGRYAEVLDRYRPRLVRGHPQAIQHLANLLLESRTTTWRPVAVTTASETLYAFQRADIERAWNAPVLDTYGLKEHNVFIAQCRSGTYHLSPEYGICEILDDNWKPVRSGEEGWIVATGLHNYAQPLLRYNTRDRAVAGAATSTCPCGRTLPTIARLTGRIDDCLRTRDGRRYSGLSFAFFGRRGIRKGRLIQDDIGHVTVELVTTPEFDAHERQTLLTALAEKVQGTLTFDLSEVEDIVQQDGGKFKFVVSRI